MNNSSYEFHDNVQQSQIWKDNNKIFGTVKLSYKVNRANPHKHLTIEIFQFAVRSNEHE